MSAALELIRTVEANGGHFRVDGEDLVISPAKAAAPVLEELRQYKPEIIELIAQRPAMPSGVRLIRWELRSAPVQLSGGLDRHGCRPFRSLDVAAVGSPITRQRLVGRLDPIDPARTLGGLRMFCEAGRPEAGNSMSALSMWRTARFSSGRAVDESARRTPSLERSKHMRRNR